MAIDGSTGDSPVRPTIENGLETPRNCVSRKVCEDFTCMEEQVVSKIGLFAESSLADVAAKRPTAAVDVHVRF